MYRLFLASAIALLMACSPEEPTPPKASAEALNPGIHTVSAASAAPLLKQHSDIHYLDVRTAEEFNSGHIAGAQNFDWNAPEFAASIAHLDRDKPYFVYCASGRRSSEAIAQMQNLGFKHLYNLEGGIQGWQREGLPISNP